MSMHKQITKADDFALVRIAMDFIYGHSIDEITLRLKEQCTDFNVACKDRYLAIRRNDNTSVYNNGVDRILDGLSVGGIQVHLMTVQLAQKEGHFNCYVWDEESQSLTYLQYNKPNEVIRLKNTSSLEKTLSAMKLKYNSSSLHLFAKQVKELITSNSDSVHMPHTTDPDLIDRCKSSRNLYEVLKKLEYEYPRLSALIAKIDETKPEPDWWLYFLSAAGLTAATGAGFYLKEHFELVKAWFEHALPTVSRWLNNTVYLLSQTPLIGVLSHGLPLMQSWQQAFMDGSITEINKLIKLSFKTVEHTLPIIGYMLCYLASGVMTVPAVAMFITGAAVDVIETLYTLLHHVIGRYFNPLAPSTEYHSASAKADADNTHQRNLSIFLVKFTANVLTAASVVVWCVFPPTLMIALTCVTFSWLVGLTKGSLITSIKNNYANAAQTDIRYIRNHYNPPQHAETEIENLKLKQENQALKQQNLQLVSENKIIREIREADVTTWMGFFHQNASNSSAANQQIDTLDNNTDDSNPDIVYNNRQ